MHTDSGRLKARHAVAVLLLVALAFAGATAVPSTASAHDFEPERQVLVQVFAERVDILITYVEAPGPRSGLFFAQFAFGGELTEFMSQFAAPAVLPRVLDGLEFEVYGEQPRTNEPEVRLENRQGRLLAAVLVSYDLDPMQPDEQRTFILRSAERSFLATSALIYEGGELHRMDDSAAAPTMLYRDSELRATFVFPSSDDQ